MTINNYDDMETYTKKMQEHLLKLKTLANLNSDNVFTNITEIINKNLEKEANINPNGCIYYILTLYATKRIFKREIQNPSKYHIPYINYANLSKKLKLVKTNKEEIPFSLIVSSFPDLIHKLIANDKKFYKLYTSLYKGTTLGRCHELCLFYPIIDYKIVTAFLPDIFSPLQYLHTYQENDEEIIDLSHNLIFDKDTFYNLLNPQITSSLTPEEWISDVQSKKINGNIKNYLINPHQTKQ